MKSGDIRKITFKRFDGEITVIGIVLEVERPGAKKSYHILTVDGRDCHMPEDCIISDTSTRQITPEARKMLLDYCKLYAKIKAEKERHIRTITPMFEELKKINSETLAEAMDRLSEKKFIDAFIKKSLKYGVNIPEDFSLEIYSNMLVISVAKNIQKHFRHGSFVYEEYDGTIFMRDDCEKDPNYQAYIQKYKRTLPVKAKPEIYLSIGDKEWLTCNTRYTLEIKKELTKQYADELAKKFVGK